MSGAILVLSGPSGAGKSTLINRATNQIGEYYFSISTTTRKPRLGEKDGVDYFFVDRADFEKDIVEGNFLEYAKVHGNYYGTSLKPVKKALADEKLVIFDIDVQGHRLVREKMGDITTSLFITPPTIKELEDRLRARSTDDEEVIINRLKNASKEILALGEYDFFIVNDEIDEATKKFVIVANAARFKNSTEVEKIFIRRWLGEE